MERKILVDLSTVMKPKEPYADSTLRNMKKDDLIEYVRVCEYNYDVAVASLNQQAENLKDWEPVVCAHWTDKTYFDGELLSCACSACRKRSPKTFPNCPYCRAKMVDETDVKEENK